jgi:hypothetical protein
LKKEKPKNEGAPRHNCGPKNISGRISEAAMGGGQGTSYFIASVVQWKEKTLDVGSPSSIYFIYIFGGRIRNSEAATSGGDAQPPVWRVNEPEKTGARTRSQNPLVYHIFI